MIQSRVVGARRRGAAARWVAAAVSVGVAAVLSLAPGCSTTGAGAATAAVTPPPPRLTDELRRAHVESFDIVWQTVRDRHWDTAHLEAIGWDRAREELRPQVEAAQFAEQARETVRELLEKLGQSHYGLIPAEAIEGIAPGETIGRGLGEAGVSVRVIDDKAVVTRVAPGSPAALAGIGPGFVVVSVRGKAVAETIERLSEASSKPGAEGSRSITLAMALEGSLTGKVGDEVAVEVEGAESKRSGKVLKLARPEGELADLLGIPIYLSRESRRLPGGAVYLRLSIFAQPAATIAWFGKELERGGDAPGVIIDLRGNLGGFGAMAMGMGGWLVDKPNQRLGTMSTRESKLNFVLNPRLGSYGGPVAIVQDELSASTSEIFAGGLQALGRARVFGTRSAGAALPSIFQKLPSGDTFQFAIANYVSVNGEALEGRGVTPDEAVATTRGALLAGRDEVLEAAERWIATARRGESNTKRSATTDVLTTTDTNKGKTP